MIEASQPSSGGEKRMVAFNHLVHADWSVDPRKRWQANAVRQGGNWCISRPGPVGDVAEFVASLLHLAKNKHLLAGFDFPIGVPVSYGEQTGLDGFVQALSSFGTGKWSSFFDVADNPDEVSVLRPFYPRGSGKGTRRKTLVSGLGVRDFNDLLRGCERATPELRAACSLFWTLGGNQVGRAAISGWLEVIRPALDAGARLWPFEGRLADLSTECGLVLAETYPAAAYTMFNGRFLQFESKRRQEDRRAKAPAILAWAQRNSVFLTPEAEGTVQSGFGASASGEDAFDAFAGLLKMIEVVDGRRPEATANAHDLSAWEGWILGR